MKNLLLISLAVAMTTAPCFAQKTGETISDNDGNTYHTVVIGEQTWFSENLKTTKLNDGTPIELEPNAALWSSNKNAYCWYNNDTANRTTYGALYNWTTVNSQKLCPTGWHVATYKEWKALVEELGGEAKAGQVLKEKGALHWTEENNGTNKSGFTALPGGERKSDGAFFGLQTGGRFWTGTGYDDESAFYFQMASGNSSVSGGWMKKSSGFSVRCLKN
jgi:uncharacterized protein (TIGR02145 family)